MTKFICFKSVKNVNKYKYRLQHAAPSTSTNVSPENLFLMAYN